MSSAQKDTIYIDIDDEITGIIEKVRTADNRIVALVLPKRAAVLQSIVNMKLLKRAGDETKKHIVLITSEASLLPLAGAIGLHVAKTLQTKPAVPPAPKLPDDTVSVDSEEVPEAADEAEDLDKSKPIGVLAGLSATDKDKVEETIDLTEADESDPAEAKKSAKKSANKKLKVPNFNKFRSRLFLGGAALILLLIFWYFATFVMPRATVIVRTDTSSLDTQLAFTTAPEPASINLDEKILPAKAQQLKKTDTEKIAATGEQDKGTKAGGTITIRNCDYPDGFTISAGSTFTGGDKNFVSTQSVTVPKFSGLSSACSLSGPASGKATVQVQAQVAGDGYNVGSRNYSVPGIPSGAKVDAVGSEMTGGTSRVVKVVSQKDVDDARKKIEERTNSDVAGEVSKPLADAGYYVLTESLIVGTPEFSASPAVGQEANEVTVTSNITYTMIGVKEADLKELIRHTAKAEIDEARQMIQTTGLTDALIRVTEKQPDGRLRADVETVVVVGPQLDIANLKVEIAGKKKSETQSLLQERPGVRDVEVKYSPFWVFSTPKNAEKINIVLEQAETEPDD